MTNIDRKMQLNYQRGYADGYRRHKQHLSAEIDHDILYMYNVVIVITIFIIFITIIILAYSPTAGIMSNYKNDCLLNIATTYQPKHCLDY